MTDRREGVIEPRAHELASLQVVPSGDFANLMAAIGAAVPTSGVDKIAAFLFYRLTRDPQDTFIIYLPTSEQIHEFHDTVTTHGRGQLLLPTTIAYPSGRSLSGSLTITYARQRRDYEITVSIDT